MKKLFTLFAAALFAGSMMAGSLIKFTEPAAAGTLDGVTFGEEFTLTITDSEPDVTHRRVSIDKSDATFGVSEEDTISFTHRLKTGIKSSSINKMTLVVPEDGPLTIYARTGNPNSDVRYFVIANGSDTIVKHICIETDTVADASSKIFKPAIVENVPAGTYEVTYDNGSINFYGFQLGYDETAAVDMTFDSEGLRYYYYDDETLSWNLSWQGKEQSSKTHKLALYRTTNLANKFGHFTTADFDLTESYYSNVGAEGEYLTAIDVTLTETEYGFTISGYVVAADGVTYNLAGGYTAPKATPSVTSFTTLSELDGLTITLSGVAVQFAGEDGSIYLTNNESETHIYGKVENYTFNNNVLTIEGFVYDAEEMAPLPEEDQDLLIMSDNVFEGYYALPLCTIHFGTLFAVENVEAVVKAQKLIENGQMIIIRDGKRYNAVGAEL